MTAKDLLRECMESAVKLAFLRHDIEPEPDTATVDEIAADAAGACFGEQCCNDKPIPEVAELLALIPSSEGRKDIVSLAKKAAKQLERNGFITG